MSDIFIKTAASGSTGWKKMSNLFVKTASSGSTGWKAALGVWIRGSASWLKVWPLSGVFATRAAWFGPDSDTVYADRMPSTAQPVVRIGSNYYGNNAQWDPNGWVITSYSYAWEYYNGTGSGATVLGTLDSGTGSGWTSGGTGQDVLPLATWTSTVSTNTDRQYLGFKVTANASNSTYSGSSVSSKVQIIRRVPQYTGSPSLSTNTPQVSSSITYTSPTWDTTEARKAESNRTTIYWYTNSTSTTTGGTYVGSGSSYTPVSGDLGKYIYAVETRYNSGTDYDLGPTIGVEAKVVTTSAVSAGLTPPTSVSISSVSRYSNTETLVTLSHSGGSGPYYQMYWVSSSSTPVTANYDAASNTSSNSISEAFSFAHNTTYYFYVRSSSQNIATTFNNGTATAGTYSAYSNISPSNPSYTFQQPSGSVSVSPSAGVSGSTTFTATPSVSASPSASISYQWQYFEGGAFGWLPISGATSSTYLPPVGYAELYGSSLRCQITANNGVGTELVTASDPPVTVLSANKTAPTISFVTSPILTNGTVSVYFTGGSGPWYQIWWQNSNNFSSVTSYDAQGTSSPVSDTTGPGSAGTYYAAVRSVDTSGRTGTGPSSTISAWSSPIAFTVNNPSPPSNTSSPVVTPSSGVAGTTFSCTTGSWTGSPTSYSYLWQYFEGAFGWVSTGSTGSTFNSTGYGGLSIRCQVTATNAGGSVAATSNSATVTSPVVIPSGGSVTLSGNSTAGSTITASTSGWSGSPTSYDVYITTALSPNTPTSSSTRVASSNGASSTSYTITSSDAISPVNVFRAFATASNSAGTSGTVQSSNVITTTQSGGSAPATPTGVNVSGSGLVTWTASSGATSYTIDYFLASNSSGANAFNPSPGSSTGTSYQINYATNPNTGVFCNYARARVRANNSAGSSSYSAWYPSSTLYV
jgi:hypothetical protein